MKALIISDIHGNLEALKGVFSDAENKYDEVWCLGDIVGYGPSPNECVEYLSELNNLKCIIGNHDAAAIRLLDTSSFNRDAQRSMKWTRTVLNETNKQFIESLPETLTLESQFLLAHGSPRAPVFEYILDSYVATLNFEEFNTNYCFVGHSHIPSIFYYPKGAPQAILEIPKITEIELKPRMIINPGSVGQPRDRNPYSSYIILDTQNHILDFRRTSYNIEKTQEKMVLHNLPDKHISRLKHGI